MHIHELRLQSHQLDAQRAFYGETLGLPLIDASDDQASFQAGSTRLTFVQSNAAPTFYHFAFNIPSNQFNDAKAWAEARLLLIPNAAGETSFVSSPHWDAEILYFYDPDGNIVEFIARHRLNDPAVTPFSAASIHAVSEIGLVVADVRASIAQLTQQYGFTVFDGQDSETFTAVGDDHGLFIVVGAGRAWFPTANQYARAAPVWAKVDSTDFTLSNGEMTIGLIQKVKEEF